MSKSISTDNVRRNMPRNQVTVGRAGDPANLSTSQQSAATPLATKAEWYKNAVIYQVNVRAFYDSNGDGVGDFPGLIQRFDYLAELGVTCLWLTPFYVSPFQDDGYDIADYLQVDPRTGTLDDFRECVRQARQRGIRMIIDLVVNHTSDQHFWFQNARRDPKSPYRDYYTWSPSKPADIHSGIEFPGSQKSTWSYDDVAQAWYFHRFFAFQPDLNMQNPRVRQEVCRIIEFWLNQGIAGFRVDAVPHVIEQPHTEFALNEFRKCLNDKNPQAVMLGEADVPAERVPVFFGDGDRLQMLFNFQVNQHLFLALARQEAAPLTQAFRELPPIPALCQWANFLRNHDALALPFITPEQRNEVYRVFAPEENMRVYNGEIRRRLAPMLNGDIRRMKLAHSLLFSLQGTPVIRYGEEIGMGEDLSLPERQAIRTPMQWSAEKNGGFSTASADQLAWPVIRDGKYGYSQLNVKQQQNDPQSFLQWNRRLIAVAKRCPELGVGKMELLDSGNKSVFMHRCRNQNAAVVIVHNLSDQPLRYEYTLGAGNKLLFSSEESSTESQNNDQIEAYGFRWFRTSKEI